MTDTNHSRRDFLQARFAGTAALTALGMELLADQDNAGGQGLPTRPLGKTGQRVSILCLGGWHIGNVKDQAEAIKIMHRAIDEGITFFDNAWDYHEGHSEELMGKALAMQGYRDKVFLMTKNCARDAQGTRKHLEDSLRRLQTDCLDLWQFHEINYDNDPDWIVERGALDEALKAQKEGKIRYLGFTGHKSPQIHLRMLEVHTWDTVQMPINICDYFYRSFAGEVLTECLDRGIAGIGMKSLGGGQADPGAQFIANQICTAEEARRYALSEPIASLVVGIDSMRVLQQDLGVARDFRPMTAEEQQALREKVKEVASDGRHETFKSTQAHDGPYHRQQHGFAVQ